MPGIECSVRGTECSARADVNCTCCRRETTWPTYCASGDRNTCVAFIEYIYDMNTEIAGVGRISVRLSASVKLDNGYLALSVIGETDYII